MYYIRTIPCLLLLFALPIGTVGEQQDANTQKNSPVDAGQPNSLTFGFVVPEEILKGLEQAGLAGDWTWEPNVDQPRVVDKARVPETVLQEAAGWITKTVRGCWLPTDLKESLIGVQRTLKTTSMSYKYDTFFAETTIPGGFLRISESDGSIGVLWHNPDIQVGPDPNKTVRLLLTCLLNLPADEVAKYNFSLKESKYNDDDSLYCGTVELPPDKNWKNPTGHGPYNIKEMPGLPAVLEEREWYQHFYVWLAAGFLFVSVEEHVPGVELPRTHFGPSPRFLNEPAEENNPADKTKEPIPHAEGANPPASGGGTP